MNNSFKFVTGYLERDQILNLVLKIVKSLVSEDVDTVKIFYGFGCENVDPPEVMVKTEKIYQEILNKEARGFLNNEKIGEVDIYIITDETEFKLCHESDIHIKTSNANIFKEVTAGLKNSWENN